MRYRTTNERDNIPRRSRPRPKASAEGVSFHIPAIPPRNTARTSHDRRRHPEKPALPRFRTPSPISPDAVQGRRRKSRSTSPNLMIPFPGFPPRHGATPSQPEHRPAEGPLSKDRCGAPLAPYRWNGIRRTRSPSRSDPSIQSLRIAIRMPLAPSDSDKVGLKPGTDTANRQQGRPTVLLFAQHLVRYT